MKHRKERMEQLLREELELIVQSELNDERLDDAKVLRVRCSGDLRLAKVGVNLDDAAREEAGDGADAKERELLGALEKAKPAIRALLSGRLSGRFVPDFTFHIDRTSDLLDLLKSVKPTAHAPASSEEE
jgi:ribosome-binding factor A